LQRQTVVFDKDLKENNDCTSVLRRLIQILKTKIFRKGQQLEAQDFFTFCTKFCFITLSNSIYMSFFFQHYPSFTVVSSARFSSESDR